MAKKRPKPDRLLGQLIQGTYQLERVLGTGGTAVVYEATHRRLARRFAIKVLSQRLADNEEALERFRREALVTSGLGHPHILEIVDFNETDDGQPYLVMELLVGETLDVRLERAGRLPIARAAQILRQTASALQAAHEQGVVHRDLKPSNVFLCRRRDGGDDFVKVLDFGISKVLGANVALTGNDSLVGTPRYMSPEQVVSSADVDLRSDIYSLGAILHEMLAGTPPFDGHTVPEVLHKIVNVAAPSCHPPDARIPEQITAVVRRALHKDRDQRFASMAALWRAFAHAAMEAELGDFDEPTDESHGPAGWLSGARAAPPLSARATSPQDEPSTAPEGWRAPITGPMAPDAERADAGDEDALSSIPTTARTPARALAVTGPPLRLTPTGVTGQHPLPDTEQELVPPPHVDDDRRPTAPYTTLSAAAGEARREQVVTTLRTPRRSRPIVALLASTLVGLTLGSAALGWLWWTQRTAVPQRSDEASAAAPRQLHGVIVPRRPAVRDAAPALTDGAAERSAADGAPADRATHQRARRPRRREGGGDDERTSLVPQPRRRGDDRRGDPAGRAADLGGDPGAAGDARGQ